MNVGLDRWVAYAGATLEFSVDLDEPLSSPYQFSADMEESDAEQTTILLPGTGHGFLEYLVESTGPSSEVQGGTFQVSTDTPCSNPGWCLIPFTYGVPFTLSASAEITLHAPMSHFEFLDVEDFGLEGELWAILPAAAVASVPEPSSWATMAVGLGLLVFIRARGGVSRAAG